MPMPNAHAPRPSAPISPVERSVALRVDVQPLRWAWGATWAFACGALAATGSQIDGSWLIRGVAAWWTVGPVMGALWAPALTGAAAAAADAARVPPDPPAAEPLAADDRAPGFRWADTMILPVAAVSVAVLLGPEAATVVVGGLALAAGLRRRPGARWRAVTRTALEVGVPGLVAWLALGGAVGVPAPLRVNAAPAEVAVHWWRINWLWPTVLALFAVVYHNATAVRRRAELTARRRWLGLAYIGVVACLAWADRPVAAAAVGWLWVVQWPFEARFQTGKVRWHWAATERLAMAAMAVAAWAAR